jgi:hypothetical protein
MLEREEKLFTWTALDGTYIMLKMSSKAWCIRAFLPGHLPSPISHLTLARLSLTARIDAQILARCSGSSHHVVVKADQDHDPRPTTPPLTRLGNGKVVQSSWPRIPGSQPPPVGHRHASLYIGNCFRAGIRHVHAEPYRDGRLTEYGWSTVVVGKGRSTKDAQTCHNYRGGKEVQKGQTLGRQRANKRQQTWLASWLTDPQAP